MLNERKETIVPGYHNKYLTNYAWHLLFYGYLVCYILTQKRPDKSKIFMDASRNRIWYEDVERHRQPSLYYLSSEDDSAGPHLIVDWNGPPTDVNEFDFDIMSKLVEMKPIDTQSADTGGKPIAAMDNGDSVYPGIFTSKTRSSSATTLSKDDGANLNFLTVPPMVDSLLKRLMSKKHDKRHPPIPEETTNGTSEVHSTASEVGSRKLQKASTKKLKVHIERKKGPTSTIMS